jgi:hypothetical protein
VHRGAQLARGTVDESTMTQKIDCSTQSHPSCFEPDASAALPASDDPDPEAESEATLSRYECVNECISSLGTPLLVGSTVAGLICYGALPLCPYALGGVAGAAFGWCEAKCEDELGDAQP